MQLVARSAAGRLGASRLRDVIARRLALWYVVDNLMCTPLSGSSTSVCECSVHSCRGRYGISHVAHVRRVYLARWPFDVPCLRRTPAAAAAAAAAAAQLPRSSIGCFVLLYGTQYSLHHVPVVAYRAECGVVYLIRCHKFRNCVLSPSRPPDPGVRPPPRSSENMSPGWSGNPCAVSSASLS